MSDDESISRRDILLGRIFHSTPGQGDAAPDQDQPSSVPSDSKPLAMLLRPPGAIAEKDFLAGCTRCNDCAQACPADAIFPASARFVGIEGTPMIDPMQAPCVMCDDPPCIAACEPDVLRAEMGLKMGTATIKAMHCLACNGTLCTVCSEHCPVDGAITLNQMRPVINEDTCTGCGVCQHVCPAPYNAVAIRPDAARYEGSDDVSGDEAGDQADWRREYFQGRSLKPDFDCDPFSDPEATG